MPQLSILLSTINDRIFQAETILNTPLPDTEFVVVHQLTEGNVAENYQSFYARFTEKPVRFIQQSAKGTGRSRNAALRAGSGNLFYLCDDDLILEPEFLDRILQASTQYPNADIFTFQIRTTEGKPYKNYPDKPYQHTLRSTATVSIVEMVIRKSAVDSEMIAFDERFGLATDYNTGEEFVMLHDALTKGAVAMYIPQVLVQHPPVSSGKIYNKTVAFEKGAMIARVYDWRWPLINLAFAVRKYKEYRHSAGFFAFLIAMYKGSMHFNKND
ncbi:MAG TPA: glycosyltransferase [Chitinophagales bacterium]|nr:glycosyltransferase [Chitinophagales bacterium]